MAVLADGSFMQQRCKSTERNMLGSGRTTIGRRANEEQVNVPAKRTPRERVTGESFDRQSPRDG